MKLAGRFDFYLVALFCLVSYVSAAGHKDTILSLSAKRSVGRHAKMFTSTSVHFRHIHNSGHVSISYNPLVAVLAPLSLYTGALSHSRLRWMWCIFLLCIRSLQW